MNKTKKFNAVDVLIVLFVLVLIVGGAYAVKRYNANGTEETKTILIEAKELKKSICDAVLKDDIAYDGTKNTKIGKITDFEVKQATTSSISSKEGIVKTVEIPERYDLYLEIEVPKNTEIQIGEHFWIETSNLKCNGYVLGIE